MAHLVLLSEVDMGILLKNKVIYCFQLNNPKKMISLTLDRDH